MTEKKTLETPKGGPETRTLRELIESAVLDADEPLPGYLDAVEALEGAHAAQEKRITELLERNNAYVEETRAQRRTVIAVETANRVLGEKLSEFEARAREHPRMPVRHTDDVDPKLAEVFDRAYQHGESLDNQDIQIGDLEGLLNTAWKLMTPEQRVQLLVSADENLPGTDTPPPKP